jgi:hypothetical protein
MLKKLFLLALVLAVWASPTLAGSEVDFNPGLWEVTSQIEMPGMTMPATTTQQCLKQHDPVPQSGRNQDCTLSDVKISGNTVTWKVVCSGEEGRTTGQGAVTYSGNSFQGTVEMQSQGMDMIMHMKGRRIGDCE